MVEKGLGREDLAVAVLIDFPFQMFAGWVAGRWSRGDKPLRPWMIAFWPRLLLALAATLIVFWFPKPPISFGFFVLLIVQTVLSSFAGTVQFGGISAFHTRISDPVVGGTYMTVGNRVVVLFLRTDVDRSSSRHLRTWVAHGRDSSY